MSHRFFQIKKPYVFSFLYLGFLAWTVFAFHKCLPYLTRPAFKEIYQSCHDLILNAGLVDILLIAWFFLVAYGCGRRILSYFNLQYASDAEAIVCASSLGCAALSFLTLGLGLLKLLYSSLFYGIFLALTVVCAADIKRLLHSVREGVANLLRGINLRGFGLIYVFIYLYLATVVAIALLAALGLEIEFDALYDVSQRKSETDL